MFIILKSVCIGQLHDIKQSEKIYKTKHLAIEHILIKINLIEIDFEQTRKINYLALDLFFLRSNRISIYNLFVVFFSQPKEYTKETGKIV